MKKLAAIACAIVLVAAGLFVVRWTRRGSSSGVASSSSTLALGVSPAVAHSDRLGELPADQQMTVRILLRSSNERQAAEDFLRAHGLTVTTIPTLDFLIVSGPVRDVNAAFGVHLYEWHNRTTGEDFYANEKPATLPFGVAAVFGLDDSARAQPLRTRQSFGSSGLSAEQLRRAYNAQSLLESGTDGSGQTVAIYAQGGFSKDNVDHFADDNGLAHPTVYVTNLSGALTWLSLTKIQPPTGVNGSFSPSHDLPQAETEMDIEAVHSIAPMAAIHVYELATNTDLGSGFDIFLVAVALYGEHIASISAGFCESDLGASQPGYADLYKRIVETYDVSVFAASGDSGTVCPGAVSGSKTETNYPASDPSVTAVGGTHLDLKSDDTMNSEQAWDLPDVNWVPTNTPEASGGGASGFARPPWQIGPGVPRGTQRLVPDVAADADIESGLRVHAYRPSTKNDESYANGGTSLAAPLWAGFAALFNQYAQEHGAPLLGLANPMLYRLAGQGDRPLFDVIVDQNGGGDLAGHAGTGWDGGTGLGSFNAYALVHDGVPVPPPPAAATLVQVYEPWVLNEASGEAAPRPGLVVTAGFGTCDGGTLADPGRAEAYRCVTDDHALLDACFVPTPPLNLPSLAVLCSSDPTSNQVELLSLNQPLPPNGNSEDANADPWFVVLADGLKCGRAGSGTDTAVLSYFCTDGKTMVTAPDRSTPTWTVQEGTFDNGTPVLSPVHIVVEQAYR